MTFKQCEHCGAYLDPGEKCDCQKTSDDKAEEDERIQKLIQEKEKITKYLRNNNVKVKQSNDFIKDADTKDFYKGVYIRYPNNKHAIIADKDQPPNSLVNTLLHETGHFLLTDFDCKQDYITVAELKVNELKAEIFTCIIRGLQAFFEMNEIDKIPNI